MNRNFHLDLDDILPGLVWGVILAVWAVGKLLRAARGGKKRTPPPTPGPPTTRSSGKDELREFLETLTGQKLGTEEIKPVKEEPKYTPPPLTTTHAAPATSLSYRPAASPIIPAKKMAIEKPMTVFRPTQIRGTEAALVALRSMRQPGASLPRAHTWAASEKHVPADLKERADLHRAMVQRIVLGPPVALHGKASSPDLPEY